MNETTYTLQEFNGKYSSDIRLSADDWYEILSDANSCEHTRRIDAILMFLRKKEHKSTCLRIGEDHGIKPKTVEALIVNFCKYVCSTKAIKILRSSNNEEVFWPIAMSGRQLKGLFEWQLHPELVEALQRYLLKRLVSAYREKISANGIGDERYKWELLTELRDKDVSEVLGRMFAPNINLLNWRNRDVLFNTFNKNRQGMIECFSVLEDESTDYETRLQKFQDLGRLLVDGDKEARAFDERVAALFLACRNPQRHAIYMYQLYSSICLWLGLEKQQPAYNHYLDILNRIVEIEKNDVELQHLLQNENDGLLHSDLLVAQDTLWQMKKLISKNNWLQKLYDDAVSSGHWAFSDWYPEYRESVERFMNMFGDVETAESADSETIRYLFYERNNYISSNAQGGYTWVEYNAILKHWPEIYEIFRRNIEAGAISREDYDRVNAIIQPLLSKRRPAAFHRLWAGLFPDMVSTTIVDKKFNAAYDRIRESDESLPARTGSWLSDNLVLMDYLKTHIEFREPWHRALFPWFIYDMTMQEKVKNDMKEYVEMLEANRNLVLTGAPGTGKTWLAEKIAEQMGARCRRVQFHPSYDYTDFVEGLRPDGEGGFERVNGVFKQFCAEALMSLTSDNFDEAYNRLVDDIAEKEDPTELMTPRNHKFGISLNSKGNLTLHTGPDMKPNGVLTRENLRLQIGGTNVFHGWEGYCKGVEDELVKKYGLKIEKAAEQKQKYVFIIDEINRGELSKIFGELFFAIDPDYRGARGRVQTQYQNLVSAGDPFADGFYVPETVYVIGTMNDIDRGVECIDFAVHRRFGWMEIRAEDRAGMLEELIPEYSETAENCMRELNRAISSPEICLSGAYEIGPAYFAKLDRYDGDFDKLWTFHLKALLREYLRGTGDIDAKMETLKAAYDRGCKK